MRDRFETTMDMIRNDLKPEFKEFLKRIESVYEDIYYMDCNDFDEYTEDESRYGMASEMKRKFRKFMKSKKEVRK